MSEVKVLIVPGTTRIASEIHNSLVDVKDVSLFGAGSSTRDARRFSYVDYKKIGRHSDDGVVSQVEQVAAEWGIDFIFLAHDGWIHEFRDIGEIADAQIIGHNPQAAEVCSFKSKTYSRLSHLIKVPEVFSKLESVTDFPVFVKPDRGQGSVGSKLIKKSSQLALWSRWGSRQKTEWVVSEHLSGSEYTVDCFSDSHSGLVFASPRQRLKINNGLASSTRLVVDSELLSWASRIGNALQIKGAWFFQAKENSFGERVLLEVGLRVAGASGIQRLVGVNLPLMAIYQMKGEPVSVIRQHTLPGVWNSGFELGFEYSQIFVDFDDTIIVKSETNLPLLKFIRGKKRDGTRISVISKNIGDLMGLIRHLGLENDFDEIIQVPPSRAKKDFILTSCSFLFIDDSFAERREVKEKFIDQVLTLDATAFHGRLG